MSEWLVLWGAVAICVVAAAVNLVGIIVNARQRRRLRGMIHRAKAWYPTKRDGEPFDPTPTTQRGGGYW